MPGVDQQPEVFDYIVVGAGTAGCVVAARLGESRDARVLLLEAGGSDLNPFIRIPVGFVKTGAKRNWSYVPEPDESRGGRVEEWPGGRVLGGSSSINGSGWMRGFRRDYDAWAATGCDGWDYEALLPYFKRSEKFSGSPDTARGDSGNIKVRNTVLAHPLIDAFLESADRAGFGFDEDLNRGNAVEAAGYMQLAQRRGFRSTCATGYLAPARRRRTVKLRTKAVVTRILIESGRAVGVEYRRENTLCLARATTEVIVAAGAIATPKLLMVSGIGEPGPLTALGIPVVAEAPAVGRNLQEHSRVNLVWGASVPTVNMDLNLRGVAAHAAEFVLHGRGAATTAPACAVVHAATADDRNPTVHCFFAPFAVSLRPQPGQAYQSYRDIKVFDEPAVMTSVWLNHPRSRGRITLRSANPADAPMIHHRMFEHIEDARDLAAGVEVMRRIFQTEPLRASLTEEILPGESITGADLVSYVQGASAVGHHPVGTCRMGATDDPEAVVDPQCRVKGVEGLRLADASVMPTLVSGGTFAPVVAIAERVADLVREDTKVRV